MCIDSFQLFLFFFSYKENKSYLLSIASEIVPVYCHMDSGGLGENGECGGGGWTLVMKIDGSKVKSTCTSLNLPVIQ